MTGRISDTGRSPFLALWGDSKTHMLAAKQPPAGYLRRGACGVVIPGNAVIFNGLELWVYNDACRTCVRVKESA